MELRPSEIFFSQDSIMNRFGDYTIHGDTYIGETLDQLLSGQCNVQNIPTISVFNKNGKWFTSDNRRLWVFRKAEELGFLEKIEVYKTYSFNENKFTTENGGVSVRIRGGTPGGSIWKSWKPKRYSEPKRYKLNNRMDSSSFTSKISPSSCYQSSITQTEKINKNKNFGFSSENFSSLYGAKRTPSANSSQRFYPSPAVTNVTAPDKMKSSLYSYTSKNSTIGGPYRAYSQSPYRSPDATDDSDSDFDNNAYRSYGSKQSESVSSRARAEYKKRTTIPMPQGQTSVTMDDSDSDSCYNASRSYGNQQGQSVLSKGRAEDNHKRTAIEIPQGQAIDYPDYNDIRSHGTAKTEPISSSRRTDDIYRKTLIQIPTSYHSDRKDRQCGCCTIL